MNFNPLEILRSHNLNPGPGQGDVISTPSGPVLVRLRTSPIIDCSIVSISNFKDEGTAWNLFLAGVYRYYLMAIPATGEYILADLSAARPLMEAHQDHRFLLNPAGLPNGQGFKGLALADLTLLGSRLHPTPVEIAPKNEWASMTDFSGMTILPAELAAPGDTYEWRGMAGRRLYGHIFNRDGGMVELGFARWVSLFESSPRILRCEA